MWKGREKLQKFEYLKNEKSIFDERKSTFHGFWRPIMWWKNKHLIKNSKFRNLKFQILCYQMPKLKGNPNIQGILNWNLQTLHYYCRKQHKNIENSQFTEQNVAISFCHFLCLLQLMLPLHFSAAEFFHFLDTVL